MRRPDDRDLDDEIRGHLALAIKERIERGEDPDSARRAALREFGYLPEVRDSMRRVWYSRWFDAVAGLARDMRFGLRSLLRSKGLTATVVITLALGIGANAAIFSVVRDVLLRPLVNRGEDRLIYIRQSAPGLRQENMTFSVPEIQDLESQVKSISAFGEFSVIQPTFRGLGLEPRTITAGVVNGSFFEVMGLRPALGRLLNAQDDGQTATPVAVLTYRFWSTALKRDPSVLGKTVQLGATNPIVVGVVEPSVPYPTDTEVIANMATSPHHNSALMNRSRTHRMTELFGRLAPGATIDSARAELIGAHAAIVHDHPETYPVSASVTMTVSRLRDQIVAPARSVLILLLASAAIVFLIACSNVANLILARSVRREGELALRAALGASRGALRRTLLAESLVLCGAGALLAIALAHPLVMVVARFASASQFSVRAADTVIDPGVLWIGVGLAMAAAILLAYVPRLPTSQAATGLGLATGSIRITPATNRRLRVFATAQIAFSFVLLAGAATLLVSLVALQHADTGFNLQQVVVFNVPSIEVPSGSNGSSPIVDTLYPQIRDRIGALPGVQGVAVGTAVPWRDAGILPPMPFTVEGYTPANGEEKPYTRLRFVSPGFFAVLGVPLIAGREFGDEDRSSGERAVIVSQSLAQRMCPNGDALNRHFVMDPIQYRSGLAPAFRIVGVVADVDDENVVPGSAMAAYMPSFGIGLTSQRLFVSTAGDPYALKSEVTEIIRDVSPDRPIEQVATLEEVRAQKLAPERLNAFVLTGFAGVALLIAVVGVAGVLAFSVSSRMRELGVRLAMGSTPRHLMGRVLADAALIVTVGVATGLVGGYLIKRLATSYLGSVSLPNPQTLAAATAILIAAALVAAMMPAIRASRVDVLQALRAD